MLLLLSPAKTLDYDSALPAAVQAVRAQLPASATAPRHAARAAELIEVLRTRSVAQIADLMSLSDELARLNVARYQAWSRRATERNSRPAMWAFDGDVYDGLQARTLTEADIDWAQRHVRLLSGLYGVLRPLDRLQPYRLEMGTALVTARGRSLYEYWGPLVAEALNASHQGAGSPPVVVNLASQEYFRVTQWRQARVPVLRARVVECVFEEAKADGWKVVSFFAKRARGRMARFAIERRAEVPEALQAFAEDGYAFDPQASQADRYVFRRRAPPPA